MNRKEPPHYESFSRYILGQIAKAILLMGALIIIAHEVEKIRQGLVP